MLCTEHLFFNGPENVNPEKYNYNLFFKVGNETFSTLRDRS